jgi:Rrf2 family protein
VAVEVSRRTDYAIRILLELARSDGAPVSVRSLAETEDVPYAFARGIQRELVAAGLVESRQGAHGGIFLARPAEQISLHEVVEALQGAPSCSVCTSDPGWCKRVGGCAVHGVWAEADKMVSEYLGTKSLAGLIESEGGR